MANTHDLILKENVISFKNSLRPFIVLNNTVHKVILMILLPITLGYIKARGSER